MANEEKNEAPAPEASAEEQANKGKKRKLFVIGGIGVIVLLAVGGGLVWFLSSGSKTDTPAVVTPEEGHADAETTEAQSSAAHPEPSAEKSESATKPEADAADSAGAKASDLVDFGCTYSFKPFNLNLGNPLENRYVRLEIAVEFGCNQEMQAEIEKRLPQLRDAIISVTSQKTREFLLSSDGKEQLRREIHNRLNHYMTKKINDVFITDILIE